MDYQAVIQTLTFLPGSSRICLNIVLIGDDIGENTESFRLRLNGVLGVIVNIIDNGKEGFHSFKQCLSLT